MALHFRTEFTSVKQGYPSAALTDGDLGARGAAPTLLDETTIPGTSPLLHRRSGEQVWVGRRPCSKSGTRPSFLTHAYRAPAHAAPSCQQPHPPGPTLLEGADKHVASPGRPGAGLRPGIRCTSSAAEPRADLSGASLVSYHVLSLTSVPATQPAEQCITAPAHRWRWRRSWLCQLLLGCRCLALGEQLEGQVAGRASHVCLVVRGLPFEPHRHCTLKPTLPWQVCRFRGCPQRSLAVLLLDSAQAAEEVLSRQGAAVPGRFADAALSAGAASCASAAAGTTAQACTPVAACAPVVAAACAPPALRNPRPPARTSSPFS